MANKVTLTLEDTSRIIAGHISEKRCFKVIKMTNTVEYTIGQYLSIEKVQDLCNINGYTVNIIPKKKR